ncbi:EF-hand calcium-binding domain-containing protein 1-like [Branchiostoma floridae]|uniref:EF-hand calcium-binding domain-containing protein 1-like n=1 Tax=Branchiostoma floridae TaxID=7739 RepID=C3YSJ7_BRAFL|nr:EF-hand calcium-binding domain-containing protein 1-like [Branchiostoma floridae]|eukprot:XP_002600686.1 hypothetical protein BRAFLDRAFT_118548 [Branchiostoma floridae]
MAHIVAKKALAKLAETCYRSTHFTKQEVEGLLHVFRDLQTSKKGKDEMKMDRATFREVLHYTFAMTDDILMDRVFRGFDQDNDSYVSAQEWVQGLSVFLRGTMEEKMKYCFEVYDLNSDGYISREEMFSMLKNTLAKQPTEEDPDEGIKDLVEITLKKMDHDHDSRLSYSDYKTSVETEPLLLEVFGPCLPAAKQVHAFTATFSDTCTDYY